jgi:PleD family two-component response regulator
MKTRALVIEDSEEIAENLVRMLKVLNVESRRALSVREAMLLLADELPDIIFLDIKMPGFDGFEVMTYLRREPKLQNVPVCIVSSENQKETVQKAKKMGAIDYILKPADMDQLERAVKLALALGMK